ncbi:MAG: flagellar motor protein [Syntrophomonadaceae bacterium]|nr:flagellar motor protein [Syntrophomonadaceae bacterium]
MDLTTLIGLILGLGALIGGFLMEGGHFASLIVGPAAIIVFGGTFGAVIIGFSMEQLKTVPGFLKEVFIDTPIDYMGAVEKMVETADRARREGLLSLESHLPEIENDFMRRGLQLVIDGTDPELTRNMLEMEINAYEEGQNLGVEIFNSAGGYGPTMGIIGTVMGLVHVLGNIEDPSSLAPAIAMAFLATLYGVASANVLWIPFATKIKTKTARQVAQMELVLEGVLSVQAGENPRVIKEKLLTFLPERERTRTVTTDNAKVGM